jgi:hypothetical protein
LWQYLKPGGLKLLDQAQPGLLLCIAHDPGVWLRDIAATVGITEGSAAEARDFADVYDLAHRFGRDRLLDWAADDDPGFDNQIFADMLASIEPLSDEDLPVQARRASELRAYFRDWAAELAAH